MSRPNHLTIRELADRLGVSPKTVEAWWYNHPAYPEPVVKGYPGRRASRWRWGDVKRWVRENRPELLE